MPRTLVISDLHIGARAAVSVLERRPPLDALLAEVERTDRLVLLGDIVELIEARPRSAMTAAAPILRAIGARLAADRPIVLVPGNHDRPLIRGWIRAVGDQLQVDSVVPADASPFLAQVVALLGGPGRVEVRYPGVWLSDRVWATHGHYLDHHLAPVSTHGILRRAQREGGRRRPTADAYRSPSDFERSRRPHASPAIRWLPRRLAVAIEEVGDLVRAATMPSVQRHVLHPRFAPLISHLLSLQMRRHSIPALARVVAQLGVDADAVIFGHVHRLGPLPGDALWQWQGMGPDGRPAFVNAGSWVYEPLLVHRATAANPYWPGGAVVLENRAEPRAIALLDGLTARELR